MECRDTGEGCLRINQYKRESIHLLLVNKNGVFVQSVDDQDGLEKWFRMLRSFCDHFHSLFCKPAYSTKIDMKVKKADKKHSEQHKEKWEKKKKKKEKQMHKCFEICMEWKVSVSETGNPRWELYTALIVLGKIEKFL